MDYGPLKSFFKAWYGTLAFLLVMLFLAYYFFNVYGEARYMSTIRDTISTSAPDAFANHTIEFRVDTDIPPGGYVRIRPDDGAFLIPTSTFSHRNAELYVAPPSSAYTLRPATTTADATNDGIAIVSGTSGNVTFILNSTTGITSGSSVRILLGDNTTLSSTTLDTGFRNPTTRATYSVYIEAGGTLDAYARAMVAIIDQVNIGPLDTTEDLPPLRFNGAPTGTLTHTITAVELSIETDELARCRLSTASSTPYISMTIELSGIQLIHTHEVLGLSPGNTYAYYVRCVDDEGNINTDDYPISFTIPPVPTGSPGTGSSTNANGGTGSGTGTGSSGSGSGSSGGGGSGSGSGGSGSGGGSSVGSGGTSDGGGSFEDNPNPYESGDGQVIITGYAFPGSTVTALVDGAAVTSARANTSGQFSVTIDQIARGVYTFGVYAIDSLGTKSSTFSTTFSVVGARSSALSNIHVMPTVKVTPNPVEPSATVVFSGFAIPNSTVTIETEREKSNGASKKTVTATSDGGGRWSVDVSTAGFARDTWKVRAKSANALTQITTQFSNYTFYGVGQQVSKTLNSDLNRDGKVNLVDFSILLFHWNTNGGTSNPSADINGDGRVTLTDFSIMIFNWTG